LLPDHEVIRRVADARGAFAAWIGAGISLEAGVKASDGICEEIRKRLASKETPPDLDAWAKQELDWEDRYRRYTNCLSKYGNAAARIRFFREIIRDVQPSFSHHAIALLMKSRRIRSTCLTTNFDKLLEMAFAQQAVSEYQAIRSEDEGQYWGEEDKNYVVKLHGDYDTANILNTRDETIRIPQALQDISASLLKRSGLIVIGSSGYEQSVISFFDDLWQKGDRTILELGVFWAVHMGDQRPNSMTWKEEKDELARKIGAGEVSRHIVDGVSRAEKAGHDLVFFPIWGGARFLFNLIEGVDKSALASEARRYLDHRMRLQDVLARGGLDRAAIVKRMQRLDERAWEIREKGRPAVSRPIHVLRARDHLTKQLLEVVYGDLSTEALLMLPFGDGRRAVVSPDDVFLSAGGGAALALLEKAGKSLLLAEMAKFDLVVHHDVVVTSAFNLPVNYIFHAATVALKPDGSSNTTADDIKETMASVLRAACALDVRVLFAPLIGSGTERVAITRSLRAMLDAFSDFNSQTPDFQICVAFVIRAEGDLPRNEVGEVISTSLPSFALSPAVSAN
jgi:O-acetyl-ADP-ribose deacetylase (regulator of RNase III)